MSRIRSKNTKPEMLVRRILHGMGFRFRLHCPGLPGKPDLALPKYRTVIFVHGCFWHRHKGCKNCTTPSSNRAFWLAKFKRNIRKDQASQRESERLGWRIVIVWECETERPVDLEKRLSRLLKPKPLP